MSAKMAETQITHAFDCEAGKVQQITLNAHGLEARILTFGAILRDLRPLGSATPLVLGYDDPSDYVEDPWFIGAIVGRCANRLTGGKVIIDGTPYQIDQNEGDNTLHGGRLGTAKVNWGIKEVGADFAELCISLPDGHMGFPGWITITCRYQLLADQALDILLSAQTDATTICNLAPHGYVNLSGQGPLNAHELTIHGTSYTPVDASGLPFGRVDPVVGTALDFTKARPADSAELDTNFCFEASDGLQKQVTLKDATSGRRLEVFSNQRGVQVFNAHPMTQTANGLMGAAYGAYAGLAIEPQNWPDAPNHRDFPSAILRSGETYLNHSRFIFS